MKILFCILNFLQDSELQHLERELHKAAVELPNKTHPEVVRLLKHA